MALPQRATEQVPGYAKDEEKNAQVTECEEKNITPVSTVENSSSGWRRWLNDTTITLGMNNVFDLSPPFVDGTFQDGYDPRQANIRGRTWYVALKKRF